MWWFRNASYHLPEAAGPLVPGCMDVMLDYSQQGILMRLYYPTETKKSDPNNYKHYCSWMPDDSYITGIAKVLMVFKILIRAAFWWSSCDIPALYGVKAKTDQKLKPVIFSHGLGGHRWLYSNFCCELASRGFLVAALEHRDNSACHTFYYESEENAKKNIKTPIEYELIPFGRHHFKKRHAQVTYRAEECSRALDFLIDLNKGKVPVNIMTEVPNNDSYEFSLGDLTGNLDLDGAVMAGHSFGGATALFTLGRRKEFRQGILLDPWMFPIKNEALETKIEQPLIFVNTQTFHIATNVHAMSKFLTDDTPRQMYTILHTTHENQSDSVLLVGYWLNWFMKKLRPLVALKINNSLILTFLNQNGAECYVDDCRRYLDEQKENVEAGLTKPWA